MNLSMRTDVEETVCFEKCIRFYISVTLLILLFLVPLLFTIRVGSGSVNLAVASFQMLFALLFVPAIKNEAVYFLKYSWISKLLLFSMCLCFIGWLFYFVPVFGLYRTWFYLAQPLFFLALVGWFRVYGDAGFSWVFLAKLISTLFALIVITIYLVDATDIMKMNVLLHPPIYRNIRHLNYDMAFVACLAFFYYRFSGWGVTSILFLLVLVVVGYFTIWSVARGELLSLAIFVGILLLSKQIKLLERATLLPLAFFVFGAVLVFVLGETYFLLQHYNVTLENMDQFSSGRFSLWQKAFSRLNEYDAWLFGMGPDAHVRLGVQPGTVQPHNFLVQWLLEFGATGTIGLCVVFGSVVIKALKQLRNNAPFKFPQVVAALYLSTLCYALVTGQFYHGLALSMILIMCAYLVVVDSRIDIPNKVAVGG